MSEAPQRPKRGPIRKVYTVIYATFCVALMSSIALQVTWYVLFDGAEADARIPADATTDSEAGRRCTQDLRGLYDRLTEEGDRALREQRSAAGESKVVKPEAGWQQFARTWQRDMTQLRARCRLSSKGMKPLRALAKDLERLEAAYSSAFKTYTRIGHAPRTRLEEGFSALR